MAVQRLTDSVLAATSIRGGCDVSKAPTVQMSRTESIGRRDPEDWGEEVRLCGRVDLPRG